MARHGTVLPRRCALCDSEEEVQPVEFFMSWYPQWVLLLALLGVLPALVAIWLARRTGLVHAGLCKRHRTLRTIRRVGPAIALAVLLAFVFAAVAMDTPGLLCLGVAALLPLVPIDLATRTLRPQRIDGDLLRVKGASPEFLDGLPRWDQG